MAALYAKRLQALAVYAECAAKEIQVCSFQVAAKGRHNTHIEMMGNLLNAVVRNGGTANKINVLQFAAIVANLDEYLVGDAGCVGQRQDSQFVEFAEKDDEATFANGAAV